MTISYLKSLSCSRTPHLYNSTKNYPKKKTLFNPIRNYGLFMDYQCNNP